MWHNYHGVEWLPLTIKKQAALPSTDDKSVSSMNPNVRFALLFYFFNGLAQGVWAYVILSAFLSELEGGSNRAVGMAEAIQGVASVSAAIPSGCVADRCSRQRALFMAVCMGLFAVVLSSITLTLNTDVAWLDLYQYPILCVCLACFGAYQGMFGGPLNSIFADSVTTQVWYACLSSFTNQPTNQPTLSLFVVWCGVAHPSIRCCLCVNVHPPAGMQKASKKQAKALFQSIRRSQRQNTHTHTVR